LIDVKSPGYEREVIAGIQRHRLGSDHGVSSTYANTLRIIRRGAPNLRIGLSTGHLAGGINNRFGRRAVTRGMTLALPTALGAAARLIHATDVMIQHRVCTERLVRHMHAHGLRVTCWTVDQAPTIRRLIALDVDGITSNRPDLVRDLLIQASLLEPT
jgi:glycerophosphoryl diester phosphodiesterase